MVNTEDVPSPTAQFAINSTYKGRTQSANFRVPNVGCHHMDCVNMCI